VTQALHGLAVGSLLIAGGCHAGAPSSGSGTGHPAPVAMADSADTVATGTVRVVGAVPGTTVILASDSGSVVLAGALTREIATLDGAHVRVQGSAAPASPSLGRVRRAIVVRSYRILDIGGREPVVGRLAVDDSGGFRIDTIPLLSPPAQFTQLVGGKLWIVGTRTASGAIAISSYGVLVLPPE
jgi:hypothetical protein